MKLIIIFILLYFLYLFIKRYIIPVYIAYSKIKKSQKQMNEQYKRHAQYKDGVHVKSNDGVEMRYKAPDKKAYKNSNDKNDEYIDYEEVS